MYQWKAYGRNKKGHAVEETLETTTANEAAVEARIANLLVITREKWRLRKILAIPDPPKEGATPGQQKAYRQRMQMIKQYEKDLVYSPAVIREHDYGQSEGPLASLSQCLGADSFLSHAAHPKHGQHGPQYGPLADFLHRVTAPYGKEAKKEAAQEARLLAAPVTTAHAGLAPRPAGSGATRRQPRSAGRVFGSIRRHASLRTRHDDDDDRLPDAYSARPSGAAHAGPSTTGGHSAPHRPSHDEHEGSETDSGDELLSHDASRQAAPNAAATGASSRRPHHDSWLDNASDSDEEVVYKGRRLASRPSAAPARAGAGSSSRHQQPHAASTDDDEDHGRAGPSRSRH